ncbi:protein kinase [Actinoplanes sp. NPDC024001]|uniref:serine/threonine-protein kinase n=1 Tax=Actinoplanes sp. NPDC024001 TaxID=3154598 RepID=UPI0033E0B1E0
MPDATVLLAGRYRLGTLLGRGGMGEVRLARDEVLERDVAVKEIDQPIAEDTGAAVRRTLREARAAARLSHPGVVQVYDVLQLEGRTWIVMEYVQSRSLRQVIDEDGPLDEYRAARLGLDLLAALRAAHRVGVQHRDVKPANVLLADDGRVLLSDFGIAAVDDDAVISRADVVVGSPQFMAPERARTGGGGPEADLWSLGATLYAAVEGRPPFQRASTMATLAALATEEPDPPRNADELRPLLDGLLRKDPAARLTAEDAESMLRGIIAALDTPQIPQQRSAPETVPDAPRQRSESAAAVDAPRDPWQRSEPETVPDAPRQRSESEAAMDGSRDPRERSEPETALDDRRDPRQRPEPGAAPVTPRVPRQRSAPVAVPSKAGNEPAPDEPSRTRRGVIAGVGALAASIAAAAALLVVAPWRDEPEAQRDRPAATGSAGPQNAVRPEGTPTTGTQQPPNAGAAATTTPPASSAAVSSAPAAAPSGGAAGGRPPLPAGWRDYRDATGFQVYVPTGWTRSKEGSIVYFRGDGRVLGIDQTDDPKPDPVADWRGQADYRRSRGDFPNYREIKIESVRYFRTAADWEFTFTRGGVRQHVNNRGVVVSDNKAYGFYWQTRDAEWSAARDDLQLVFDSFRPAA